MTTLEVNVVAPEQQPVSDDLDFDDVVDAETPAPVVEPTPEPAAAPTAEAINTDEEDMYKMIETVSESVAACADFPERIVAAPHDEARVRLHSGMLLRQQKTLEELRELMVLIVNVMDARASV